jgi:hypothetical protein
MYLTKKLKGPGSDAFQTHLGKLRKPKKDLIKKGWKIGHNSKRVFQVNVFVLLL